MAGTNAVQFNLIGGFNVNRACVYIALASLTSLAVLGLAPLFRFLKETGWNPSFVRGLDGC